MDTRKVTKYSTNILLIIIVLSSLMLRSIGIENPLLDDQAWRQTDTASMALHMEGKLTQIPDVFFPRLSYDGLTPQKVELEFPLFPYLLAWTWHFLSQEDIWGRVWAIIFSAISVLGVFFLGKNLFTRRVGLIAAALYAVLPLAIYYGRVIMPEPLTQALSIWALNSLVWWRSKESISRLIIAGLLMAAAVLTKLPQLMIFPVAIVIGFLKLNKSNLHQAFFYSTLALMLPATYYISAHFQSKNSGQFVSGIFTGQVIKGTAFWYPLQKNIEEGLTYIVILLSILSLVLLVIKLFSKVLNNKEKTSYLAMILWSAICILYVLIICSRIPLDYYLVPILPLIVILLGILLESSGRILSPILTVLIIIMLIYEGNSYLTKKLVWNNEYLIQADWISRNTPDGSVIILSDSPPMTFYYSKRLGFRLVGEDEESLEKIENLPGNYLVRIPQSNRSNEFWKEIDVSYDKIGPGVYEIKRVTSR